MKPAHTSVLLLEGQTDKHQLLQAFANHCQFPDYFGDNWDALQDCLADWINSQPQPLLLILDGQQQTRTDSSDWQVCLDILADSSRQFPSFTWQLCNMHTPA